MGALPRPGWSVCSVNRKCASFTFASRTFARSISTETGAPTRVGGVRWTIKDGIVYDARRLLADVREMVQLQKRERAAAGADTEDQDR